MRIDLKFLKRIGYYLIGVSLGSIVVLFIWEGKDVSFPYGPNARTLRSIQKKQLEYSENAIQSMTMAKIDTSSINEVLRKGEVDFSKSLARKEPCAEYFISGFHLEKTVEIYVKRCDSVATIQRVEVKN